VLIIIFLMASWLMGLFALGTLAKSYAIFLMNNYSIFFYLSKFSPF